VANYEQKQNAVIRPMRILGLGGGRSLVSGVADEANSELLNTGEASKPNGTPSAASDPP
jgi:hypothetical protein